MKQQLEPLFTPWKIEKCEIKNRIVLTSMGGTDFFGWMEKNHFDKEGANFILEVAKNNVGLILPGCQPVYNPMFGQWLYNNDKTYRDLSDSLHLARCAVNAETMQTNKHVIKRASSSKKVIIIGGGIGEMEAARVLHLRGHKPVIDSPGEEFLAYVQDGMQITVKENGVVEVEAGR